MPYSVFEDNDSSGLESKHFGGALLVMFLRESEKQMNLKATDVREELDELRHS